MAKSVAEINPLAGLEIGRLIVHEIFPRLNGLVPEPRLSNDLEELTGLDKLAFESRLHLGLGANTKSIEMTVERHGNETTFQSLVSLLRSDIRVFKQRSQALPKRLAEAQTTHQIPGGYVFVFDGKISTGEAFVGVIKAKRSDAFRIFNHKLVRDQDVVMAKNERLFKAAIMLERRSTHSPDDIRNPDDFQIFVYDNDLLKTDSGLPRAYFAKNFLGCAPLNSAASDTLLFFNKTLEYLNREQINDLTRITAETELHRYIKSDSGIVSVNEFAELLPEELKERYASFMQSHDVSNIGVTKDVSMIQKKLLTRTLKWGDITLSAKNDSFEHSVEMLEDTDEGCLIRIKKALA